MSDYLIHNYSNRSSLKINKLERKQRQLSLNYPGLILEQKLITPPKTPKAYNQMSTQTYQKEFEQIEIQNLKPFMKHQSLLAQLENYKEELRLLERRKEEVEQLKDLSEEIGILKQELGIKYEIVDLEEQERCIRQLESEDLKFKDALNQKEEELKRIQKLVQEHLKF